MTIFYKCLRTSLVSMSTFFECQHCEVNENRFCLYKTKKCLLTHLSWTVYALLKNHFVNIYSREKIQKKKGENNLPLNRFSQTYYIVKRNKKTQLNCTGIPQYIFLDTYTHHRLLFSL